MTEYKKVNTQELQERIKAGAKLLDVRPVDAFNGWKLKNESRGGHIKGAKSLPLKWTSYMDWIEIVRHKEIMPSDELILYGYTHEESTKVADMFKKADYENISVYEDFLEEWVPNE